ncbi:MAG: hypothetical protein SGILL_000087 [Bacillariaceae sp.]
MKPTIRTITAFVVLRDDDFQDGNEYELASFPKLEGKLEPIFQGLRTLESAYQKAGYTVQTLRIATNPFGEWLLETTKDDCFVLQKRLNALDHLLSRHSIFACAVGPAKTLHELSCCRQIVGSSTKFSCSFMIPNSNNVDCARKAAETIYDISKLHPKGLTNFQFCVAAKTCQPFIPFFPIAYSASDDHKSGDDDHGNSNKAPVVRFAIGLENGPFVKHLLQDSSIAQVDTLFRHGVQKALLPIQNIAHSFADITKSIGVQRKSLMTEIEKLDSEFQKIILGTVLENMYPNVAADLAKSGNISFENTSNGNNPFHFQYIGMDTSVNPSLDEQDGSVAGALECLAEVERFGGPGTMSAAAAITRVLQSLEGIQRTGYCGLMLPVCEDRRLAELASQSSSFSSGPPLSIVHLLNISSVCGVGVDTVPIEGDSISDHAKAISRLSSLLLDVVGLAERWNKPLTCRVFPVPGRKQGETADFRDSPHLVNSRIFSLEY